MCESSDLSLAERLAEALLLNRFTLVTAESCTGGGIAQSLTNIPGSSKWFDRGFVTYSNESKQELLGVSQDILTRFGAVSEECAAAMVEGAIGNSHADVGVSVTGIAGPDGGSADKPVGTVCFGWARRKVETLSTQVIFNGDRQEIRQQSILMAIQGLLDLLEA
jgi:nicotinamide-nucleotide amidase